MSRVMRKPGFGLCKNKDADSCAETAQLISTFFRYLDSTVPLLPKSDQAYSHLLRLYEGGSESSVICIITLLINMIDCCIIP